MSTEKLGAPASLTGGGARALRTIMILYVEDEVGVSDLMQPQLGDAAQGAAGIATWPSQGRTWSSQSRHVCSMQSAMDLLEKEGFKPDLVLHDGRIPYSDGMVASTDVGDDLYRQLIDKRLPILVISSDTHDGRIDREPYRSNPPRLGFLEKKASVAEVRLKIEEHFREQLEK